MNNELRERDSLWCKALVATLGIEEIARVTAEFNRIRPDKAVEHSVRPTYGELPASDIWTTPKDLPAPIVRLDPPISW